MMKRKWILLLAVVLAALLPCAALAAPGDANIAMEDEMREKYQDSVYGACVSGDTLYMYGGSHIFTYRMGDADVSAVEFQLPEPGEYENRGIQRLFSDGESLYALCTVFYYGDDTYGIRSAEIYPVEVGEDAATFGEPVELNIDELTVSYGGDESYFIQINATYYAGGYLMMYVYKDNGEEAIYALDIETGEGSFIDGPERIRTISNYADGQLLIESYDYTTESCEFYLYDPASESLTSAREPLEGNDWYSGLVYSEESGRLFYMNGGYVMAAEGLDFENAKPVAELSTLYYSESGGMLLPGDYYVCSSYDSTCIRSTDPNALPETRLVVKSGYSDSIMSAYYAFGNTHGDVAVVLDNSYSPDSEIIESMMGRDDSVDIYMISVSRQAYDALYNRGYMVELDNPAIVSEVQGMYPAIQEVLTRDGEAVAIPVSVYGWTFGIDYEGFEKIGIAREDVPDNWSDLLDLMVDLPDMLPEDGRVRIFEEYYTQRSIRDSLISEIMKSWRIHQTANGREVGYDDPQLLALFEKVMALDYEAMGLPEDDENDEYMVRSFSYDGNERTYTLFEMSIGCTIGNFYSNSEPALLSVIPGEAGEVPLQLSVAFVNPFSKHVDLAQEFLVEMMNSLEQRTAYNLSDALNEPVRNRYTIEYIENTQKDLEQLRAQLDTADPVDVPDIEESIANLEMSLEDMDRYGWDIPEKDITWYRTHADRLAVEQFDFLYATDDDYSEMYELSEQFLEGKVSAADFLKEIDRKVRMRALEGN